MALEYLAAYAVLVGLPLWLVVEEVVHRFVPRPKRQRARAAAKGAASAERRSAERAPAHASSI